MGEIDYTKLEWGDQIFCPHCGKLLKPKNHTIATGCGLGNWDCDPEYTTYQTYKCPDCGIKATTRDYSIGDPRAWKFPKDHETTVTQSQLNYITFLASHFHNIVRDMPIITDKRLAAIWISQFVQELDKENQIKIYEQKIEKLFQDIGFKFSDYDILSDNSQKDHNIMKFSHLEYSHNHDYPGSFYTYLYFYKDTHEIKFGVSQCQIDIGTVFSYVLSLTKQVEELKVKIESIQIPSISEAREKTIKDRDEYKKVREQCPESYEDPYDPYDDDWGITMHETF